MISQNILLHHHIPLLFEQWYLYHTQIIEAWDIIRGDTTRHSIIAIVDTGIDWDNPEILPNIWVNNPEDLNSNGILDNGAETRRRLSRGRFRFVG